MARQELKHHK